MAIIKPAPDDAQMSLSYEAYNDIYYQYMYPDDNNRSLSNTHKRIKI
jgi:hypothetical protein